MNRQLADDTPDAEELPGPVEAAASVDVQRDRLQLAAHDPDRFETDAALARQCRRSQRPRLYRDAHARFVLEHALLQDAFERHTRIRELDVGALLEIEFAYELDVLRDAIVENDVGRRDGVLTAGPVKVEIPQLDLDFFRVGNSRVSRNEWSVGPRRSRYEQNGEQRYDALNR